MFLKLHRERGELSEASVGLLSNEMETRIKFLTFSPIKCHPLNFIQIKLVLLRDNAVNSMILCIFDVFLDQDLKFIVIRMTVFLTFLIFIQFIMSKLLVEKLTQPILKSVQNTCLRMQYIYLLILLLHQKPCAHDETFV